MIIGIWKPKYRGSGKSKYINYWYLVDLSQLTEKKDKDLKVIYKCDICGIVSNAVSHRILKPKKKDKYNSLERQICTSCRSKTNERERRTTISFEDFQRKLEEENYILLTSKKEFDFYDYPAQKKVEVMCPRGHIHYVTWNNFSKGRRCRECYSEKKMEDAVKYKEGIENYRFTVISYTKKTFKKYREKLEEKYQRSRDFHLDHKFSIAEGFKQSIPPYIIGSYYNLEILSNKDNINKKDDCSISKEELFKKYFTEVI